MRFADMRAAPLSAPARAGRQPGSPPPRPRSLWRRIRGNRSSLLGLVIVVLLTLAALGAPLLAALEGQTPNAFHSDLLDSARGGVPIGAFGGVGGSHWLGVEPGTGRDLLARAVYGARVSLGVAVGATGLRVLIGILVGLAAGLGGKLADSVLTRSIDLSLAFPELIFGIALLAIVPASVPRPLVLAAVIALLGWGGTARVVRGQVLSLRARDYVSAARLSGAGPARVAAREILPGLTAPVLTFAALTLPTTMVLEASLSFLGVGVRPPTPSWGQMLSSATTWFRADPMYVLVPAGLLFVTLLAFTLLADGVRAALDPRAALVPPARARRPARERKT